MNLDLRNTTADHHYLQNEIARAMVEERLTTTAKDSISRSARVSRKLRNLARNVFGS